MLFPNWKDCPGPKETAQPCAAHLALPPALPPASAVAHSAGGCIVQRLPTVFRVILR